VRHRKTWSFGGIVAGISTFLIGVFAVGISMSGDPVLSVDVIETDPIPINSCALVAHSDQLLNQPVIVNALLFRYAEEDEGVLVYPGNGMNCGISDPEHGYFSSNFYLLTLTTLDLDGYSGPHADIGRLLATSKKHSEIDVRIEGILVQGPSRDDRWCHYRLVPTNITFMSAWRPFTPKGAA